MYVIRNVITEGINVTTYHHSTTTWHDYHQLDMNYIYMNVFNRQKRMYLRIYYRQWVCAWVALV